MDLAGTKYPANFGGKEQPPLPGRSFAPVLTSNAVLPPRTLYFQLFNNMAVVDNGWRLVTAYGEPWQLYDLTHDRTETHDLAASNPEKLQHMLALQKAFHERPDVRLRINSGEREPEYAPIYKADGNIGPGAKETPADPEFSLLASKARAEGRQLDAEETAALKQKAKAAGPEAQPAKGKRKKTRSRKRTSSMNERIKAWPALHETRQHLLAVVSLIGLLLHGAARGKDEESEERR